MKEFTDESGARWFAGATEEQTPRHHSRWFLIFHPADDESAPLAMPEVRWQTAATAARTLRTMSDFELRRRLHTVRERALIEQGASPDAGAVGAVGQDRARTSASAG